MRVDLEKSAFSAAGSFICVSLLTPAGWDGAGERGLEAEEGLYLRFVRENVFTHNILARFLLLDQSGRSVPFAPEATPWELGLAAGDDKRRLVRMAFDGVNRLRIAGGGAALRLVLPEGSYCQPYGADRICFNLYNSNARWMLSRLSGKAGVVCRETPGPLAVEISGGEWEIMIEDFYGGYEEKPVTRAFDECVEAEKDAFTRYAGLTGDAPARFADAARQAMYVNRSAQVGPEGLYESRVTLMSKNWMKAVWTWDCAINTAAISAFDPEGAWANFIIPFLHQHADGTLPDMVGNEAVRFSYTKPPIHGWILSRLREAGALDGEKRAWIYPRLKKLVGAWYNTMDWDHDGMCQYNHGNDSGWDNASCFSGGKPLEGPDLAAYLALCWEELARLADELNLPEEAEGHRARAKKQIDDLIAHSWDGERFIAYESGAHEYVRDCDSLLPFLPILLGKRLPGEIFAKLAAGLKEDGRFLTPYGLATERVGGKYYVADGYWLGPIWAPPMLFIVEGLIDGGEAAFAKELAERFCSNCAKNGFAENFDADTGKGLRDKAYTWTSSVFLMMMRRVLMGDL